MPKAPERLREFSSLIKVVEDLRGPQGCPWDKEQTHRTLTRYLLEESFELVEAIESGSTQEMRDELGDVLFQVVLHAEIARQNGSFSIADVIQGLNEKMVRRHPHVFADVKVSTSGEVLQNWAEIKAAEKKAAQATSAGTKPLSFDMPMALPALLRAQKIGEKTKKVAFDWQSAEPCWEKVLEELQEVEEAKTQAEKEDELGDLLFSLAQWARHQGLDSEQALRRCNARFEERYRQMQTDVQAQGKNWENLSAEDREKFWKGAKAKP